MTRISWAFALLLASMKSVMANRKAFAASALGMLVNNLMYFAIWWLFFDISGEVRGWSLAHLSILYGTVAFAFGFTMLFFGGVRDLAYTIDSGRLDVHLGKPRHPLLVQLLSGARPSGFGDLLTGPLLWFTLGGLSLGQGMLALILSCAAGVVLLATLVALHSLAFWKSGSSGLIEQLFSSLIVVSSFPHHVLPEALRIFLLTAIPAGFIGVFPTDVIAAPSMAGIAGTIAAAAIYMTAAVWIFNRGLRRYRSGNMMAGPTA